MKQLTEDYVSYEIAKLLKEKGFDVSTMYFFSADGTERINSFRQAYYPEDIAQPTQQMTLKWLREVHRIFIQIELYSKYDDYWFEVFQNTHRIMMEKRDVYNSYEEAVEAAILYVLKNLI